MIIWGIMTTGRPATHAEERRREQRQHIGSPLVKLDPGLGGEPIGCFVWDISERGARLKLARAVALSDVVGVLIGNVRKDARVVWRKEDQIGVEFFPES
jgi:hypothetical protein